MYLIVNYYCRRVLILANFSDFVFIAKFCPRLIKHFVRVSNYAVLVRIVKISTLKTEIFFEIAEITTRL